MSLLLALEAWAPRLKMGNAEGMKQGEVGRRPRPIAERTYQTGHRGFRVAVCPDVELRHCLGYSRRLVAFPRYIADSSYS